MARYIDADNIPYYLDTSEEAPMEGRKVTFKSDIDRMPTADVVEVKHGEWFLLDDGSGTCTLCGKHQKNIWDMDNWQNFCGHCGAKMDGGKEVRQNEL